MSYNIQAGIATRRFRHYLTQGWKQVLPHPQSRENLDNIARIIQPYDIVGLQEVDAGSLRSGFVNQTEHLARRAHFPYWYHQTNRRLGRLAQTSNGLLSRFIPQAVEEHRLPGRGRGALWVRFGEEEALIVVIIHLALGRRARLEQIHYLVDLLRGCPHAVVMGDLNCTSRSLEMRILQQGTGLLDPTYGLTTFPSWRPILGLDHILVTPALKVERVRVLHHPYSDHLPIAMEIALPRALGIALAREEAA
ncbi:MAG: EEP domain-containing protein [Gammaproteobacteria bacterium]|nr:MAG: EEP domain-containing protein [Gammaproteobacteria bacterium]